MTVCYREEGRLTGTGRSATVGIRPEAEVGYRVGESFLIHPRILFDTSR